MKATEKVALLQAALKGAKIELVRIASEATDLHARAACAIEEIRDLEYKLASKRKGKQS